MAFKKNITQIFRNRWYFEVYIRNLCLLVEINPISKDIWGYNCDISIFELLPGRGMEAPMIFFLQWKLQILAFTIIAALGYIDYRFHEKANFAPFASGKATTDELSNLSTIKRLDSLAYWENPYQATTGYPD